MLVLHYDVPSLAATVAALRLQQIADAGGAVAFSGIDVLGVEVTLPVTLDQLEELERYADRAADLGLTVRRPAERPPTFAVHLISVLAEEAGLGAAWRAAVFRAYWSDGARIGEHAVLLDLATSAGLDRQRVANTLSEPMARLALRRRMAADRGRGVGGVPVLESEGTFVPADLPEDDLRQLADH